ncbi:MAG TPA: DUF58 domain-containing protein [Cellulomonas sp.]
MTTLPDRLLRHLEWRVVRRLEGELQGAHRTVARGPGLDLAGLREYLPGDDVRHIDWNATARLDEPHVREFLAERDLTAWFVLDRSASMRTGRADRSRADVQAELVGALATVLVHGGNRVGAILADGASRRVVPPGTGRTQVLRLLHELTRDLPAGPRTTTDLGAALDVASATITRRSLVLVVSDLLAQPGWEVALGRLASRHEVVLVQLTDDAQDELPEVGWVLLEDGETGEQVLVDSADPVLRRSLRTGLDAHDEAAASAAHRARARLARIDVADDLVPRLVALVRNSGRLP